MKDDKEIGILETGDSTKVKKELLLIKKFMGMDFKEIKVRDERTKTFDD